MIKLDGNTIFFYPFPNLFFTLTACDLKSSSVNNFLGGIDASGWIRHIKALLDTALFMTQAIDNGISVLVHCSDGWDRTAQVCSLASILLDPYYRTIQGYQVCVPMKKKLYF